MKKTIVLIIIDGLGITNQEKGNAFKLAKTPNLNHILETYPNSLLKAAGEAVGLPKNQMGNSEVGHLNIGAGEVVYTGLTLIERTIENNTFKQNLAFLNTIKHVKTHNSNLHLMGLLSPGGVHSLEKHLFHLLDLVYEKGIKNVQVHAFADGRDVSPKSFKNSLDKLIPKLNQYKFNLATIAGRFYGMDRDKIFSRTKLTYQAILGITKNKFTNPYQYLEKQYQKGNNDEFIEPAINENSKSEFITNNDGIIFFNFRSDRARQLTHCLMGKSKLYDFNIEPKLKNLHITTMMKYEGLETNVAFENMKINTPIGKVIANYGLKQLRLAETQKYAHVTYFIDGGIDIKYKNTKRIMIPSQKVKSFISAPKMSLKKIIDTLIKVMKDYDLSIVNIANPDMVGHTGNLQSTIIAIEETDKQIGRVLKKINALKGTLFITADHGNAETMLDQKNKPVTKHTSSPVMFVCTDKNIKLNKKGKLANVAPTILEYMNLKKGDSMKAKSLILKKKSNISNKIN